MKFAYATAVASMAVTLLVSQPAQGHIQLQFPIQRTPSQKDGPCGAVGGVRGPDVSTFAPGATITVQWNETVNHPGHYRIMFDDDGQDAFFEPDSPDDIRAPGGALLVDGITDAQGGAYEQTITFPDIECDNCTLQVIQLMTDKAPYGDGNDLYYQCADITLAPGGDPGNPGGPGDPGELTGGCSASHGTGSGTALFLVLAAALGISRRRRRPVRHLA